MEKRVMLLKKEIQDITEDLRKITMRIPEIYIDGYGDREQLGTEFAMLENQMQDSAGTFVSICNG